MEAPVRTTVIVPNDVYETLKVVAEQDRRSLHQQIIYVLEQYAGQERERRGLPTPVDSD